MFAVAFVQVLQSNPGMDGDPVGLVFGIIILALWILKQIGTPVRR